MEIIRVTTIVDRDQVIRPPSGVTLPQGEIEVTVHFCRSTSPSADDPLAQGNCTTKRFLRKTGGLCCRAATLERVLETPA